MSEVNREDLSPSARSVQEIKSLTFLKEVVKLGEDAHISKQSIVDKTQNSLMGKIEDLIDLIKKFDKDFAKRCIKCFSNTNYFNKINYVKEKKQKGEYSFEKAELAKKCHMNKEQN